MLCKFAPSPVLYYLCGYGKVVICCKYRQLLWRSIEILALYVSKELLWTGIPVGDIGREFVGMFGFWRSVCLVLSLECSKQLVVSVAHHGLMWRFYHLLDLCQ